MNSEARHLQIPATLRPKNDEPVLGRSSSRSRRVCVQDPARFKKDVVKVFATGRSDQSRNEWMRLRRIRDGPDLIDLKDAKICLSSVVAKNRIVIGTEIARNTVIRNGSIEHTARNDPKRIGDLHRDPKRGLHCFISTTARTSSGEGPLGHDILPRADE